VTPGSNQATTVESQLIQEIQYVLGQTLRDDKAALVALFFQRACAAKRANSERSAELSTDALALPPLARSGALPVASSASSVAIFATPIASAGRRWPLGRLGFTVCPAAAAS